MIVPGQTEEMMDMFGSKGRRERREREVQEAVDRELRRQRRNQEVLESNRPTLNDAVREVLASPTQVVLRAPGYVVIGANSACDVSIGGDPSTEEVISTLSRLRQQFGRRYSYGVSVTGKRPTAATHLRHQLSPGWRSYADEDRLAHERYDTPSDFSRAAREGLFIRGDEYRIIMSRPA